MNVTTIGFPFAAAPGAPVFGAVGQDFALALGTAAGLGTAMPGGAKAANDMAPAFANDAAPVALGANQFVRTQPGSSITLAQLLATGSKIPAPIDAAQPGQIAADTAAQAPADAIAQQAAATLTELPVEAEPTIEVEAAPAPKGASPDPALTVNGNMDEPAPSLTAAGEPPVPLDLPTAGRPTVAAGRPADGILATSPVATPVKTRKPVAVDPDVPALPADPSAAQPATTPVVAGATPPPAPVATPDLKFEPERGGKAAPVALGQANVAATDNATVPAAKPGKELSTPSNEAPSLPDAALPAEVATKIEARPGPAALPPQSFASQVTQSAAQAPAHLAAPAPAAAASDPMIPARAGQLGHALGVEIARKIEAGEDTLRVRLNPVELGRVEVTLAFDDNGKLRATMRAESQHALNLLRQDAPDLGRALDSAGVRADAQSFRFESRSDSNGGSAGQSGQQQSRGNSQQSFNDEPETPAPAYRAIRNDGQVDLLA